MSTWNQNFFFFILILLINKILLRPILPPTNIKSTMIFDSTIYDNEEYSMWRKFVKGERSIRNIVQKTMLLYHNCNSIFGRIKMRLGFVKHPTVIFTTKYAIATWHDVDRCLEVV